MHKAKHVQNCGVNTMEVGRSRSLSRQMSTSIAFGCLKHHQLHRQPFVAPISYHGSIPTQHSPFYRGMLSTMGRTSLNPFLKGRIHQGIRIRRTPCIWHNLSLAQVPLHFVDGKMRLTCKSVSTHSMLWPIKLAQRHHNRCVVDGHTSSVVSGALYVGCHCMASARAMTIMLRGGTAAS